MKKITFAPPLLAKIAFVLVLIAGSMATATALWNQIGQDDAVIETSEQVVVDKSEYIDITIKYLAYTGLVSVPGTESPSQSSTTLSGNSYTAYNNMVAAVNKAAGGKEVLANFTSNPDEDRTFYPKSNSPYEFRGDSTSSGTQVALLYVTADIKCTLGTDWSCNTTYTWSGTYYVNTRTDTDQYQERNFNETEFETISIYKNDVLTRTQLEGVIQMNIESGYNFIGLKSGTSSSNLSSTYYDYKTAIEQPTTFYAIFNKEGATGLTNTSATRIINNRSTNGTNDTITLHKGASGDNGINVTNDHSYIESLNTISIGDNSTSTTIASGDTLNLCLNNASVYEDATSTKSYLINPEARSGTLQYTVVLQNDLYVNGTLTVGSNFGSSNDSTHIQGQINGAYVCLDLNGHNIYIGAGASLLSYGLIKDSVGSGAIYNNGGTMLSLIVAYDSKGGSNTTACVGSSYNLMPFNFYHMPYLRCKYVMRYNETAKTWGVFKSLTSYFVATIPVINTPVIADFELNFVGDVGTNCFFSLTVPETGVDARFEFECYRLEAIQRDIEAANSNYYNSYEYKYCGDWKMNFSVYNLDFSLGSMSFEIEGSEIDTSVMTFPFSNFIDVSFYNSKVRILQALLIAPGVTLYADANSEIILSGNNSSSDRSSGAFYAVTSPYAYYKNGQFISTDNINFDYTENVLNSTYIWKYLDAGKVDCHGTVRFDKNTSSATYTTTDSPYVLSGNMNISYAGWSDETTKYSLGEFLNSACVGTDAYFQTYGLEFYLNTGTDHYHKATTGPLTSFMTSYAYDNLTTKHKLVGTYDSTTGIYKVDNKTYFFQSDRDSFSGTEADRRTVSITECELTNDGYAITAGGKTYLYFAGIYCPLSSGTYTDGSTVNGTQYTLNTARLSSTTTHTVKFYSQAQVWAR